MFKIEFLNDRGDWIFKCFRLKRRAAEIEAEKVAESGYTARVIHEGKIIKYFERAAK